MPHAAPTPIHAPRAHPPMEPSPPAMAAEATDLLSSLPAHLLDEILGRLSLRDAVRTSALSRAWRNSWESLPGLALSFPKGTHPVAVDGVLLRYTGPGIRSFAFFVDPASASHVDHWLIALSHHHRIESISISCIYRRDMQLALHSSIFSCARLVSLDLRFFIVPPLPVGFAGFPVLKELYLSDVKFPDNDNNEGQLQAIIRGSPLLRVLFLDDVEDYFEGCVIEVPKLHSLTFISNFGGWPFGKLPCLQYASVFMPELEDREHDFGKYLARIAQVRELTFYAPADRVNIGTTPFTFYNLKSLELSANFFSGIEYVLLTFSLLRSSPNLEKLTMMVRDSGDGNEENAEFLNAQWTDGMCANLQVVQIMSDGDWFPMSFMKLILSKASHLCTFSVNECQPSKDNPLNELLTCRKASAQAQVLFKGQLEDINFHRMKKYAENDPFFE